MEKIAIIGLSCLFPDAQNPEQFWHNLIGEKDSASLATADELGVDPAIFYDPEQGTPDKTYSLKGGFIKNFAFEATGYNLPSAVIEGLDTIFKGSLYVAKQALENSNYWGNEKVLSNCGVILGNLSLPTKLSNQLLAPIYQRAIEPALGELLHHDNFRLASAADADQVSPYNAMLSSLPSGLVAQALSLGGINFSLDAACSSSLYAVKLACDQLLSRKTDLMLAGAVSFVDSLFLRMVFSGVQAYPTNGVSQPFDKSSRGLTPSEGVGMVVLKRYSDALRDGDQIYATICGAGLSNDGKGKHLLSPNQRGQVLAFDRAYAEAGINPKSIDYLECHGTGTLLGDTTELASMEAFFGQHQAAPLVGSVKSNVGHLLTAAGMVSIIKVILSMSKGVIPPTINITEPLESPDRIIGPEQIVRTATPWPNNGSLKRGAVSAFGFGGTNGHLILEQPSRLEPIPEADTRFEPVPPTPMAIVGMDAFFGVCNGLDAFDRCVYDGNQAFIPVPPQRWQGIEQQEQLLKDYGFEDGKAPLGGYIKELEIDPLHFKIPPNEVGKVLPQQLLMLQVADRALRDAGLVEGGNVAVIVAMEAELSIHQLQQRWNLPWQIAEGLKQENLSLPDQEMSQLANIAKDSLHNPAGSSEFVGCIGNIMPSRISALWDFNGPSFTMSAGENSTFKALEVAQRLLATGEVDAVLVGAVDLAGGVENVLLRNKLAKVNTGVNTLGYDQKANGWTVGEGAGAVVLKRHDTAKQEQHRIYAVIDALSLVQDKTTARVDNFPTKPNSQAIAQACQQAHQLAGLSPKDVHYLEVFSSGIPLEDDSEIAGLMQAYKTSDHDLSCAIGSVKANVGHTYVASGIASLIKTALCLYHRYIPPVPQWSSPKKPEAWQGSPFYVDTAAKGWYLPKEAPKRVAAINSLGIDGTYAHLILSDEPSQVERHSRYLEQMPFNMFPIAANSREEVLEQLSSLQKTIEDSVSLSATVSHTFAEFQKRSEATYALAILGRNKEELAREIQRAFSGVANAFEQGKDWQTPVGSCFTANPLGREGKIAFVYPGAFNAYIGFARNIFRMFPKSTFDDSAVQNADNLLVKLERVFAPRSLNKLSRRQLEALEQELLDNAPVMLEAGIGVSGFLTAIMRDYFQVQADYTFGYSLGEISMICCQGIWPTYYQEGRLALNSSPLFGTRLSGRKDALREYWGLSEEHDCQDPEFWATYVLMVSAEQLQECLKDESHVYLTHINTPTEVVISGDKQACQRVMKTLNCEGFSLPLDHVLHCEAMLSEYEEIARVNTLPAENTTRTVFYSAADYEPVKLDSESIAKNIAKALCQPLDFPRLINRVYEDGARIFIEAGASGTCSRWLDVNLKDKDHVTVSLDKRGANEHTSILKALAKLVIHRVPLNLSPLYCQTQANSDQSKSIVKTITLGRKGIAETILSEENQKIFKNISLQELPSQSESQPVDQSIHRLFAEAKNTNYSSEANGNSESPKDKLVLKKAPDKYQLNGDICNSLCSQENLQSEQTSATQEAADNHQSNQTHSTTNNESVAELSLPKLHSSQCQKLSENNSRLNHAQAVFLDARQESLRQMCEIIQNQIEFSQQLLAQESLSKEKSLVDKPVGGRESNSR
ncbi:PfaB family protein [Lyngbya aestuarii]|uniref:PfaB family protein n=1 Tax=Lyngbya aestuarii TaxID=118322 RepID=UPI00403E291D